MTAAIEVRSTLPDGRRRWHIVQTDDPARARAAVFNVVGPHATIELTGTTFHDVAEGLPRVATVHQAAP